MNTVPCRSCQSPIGFITMPTGSHMPVDPELVKTYLVEPAIGQGKPLTLVTERGKVLRGMEVSLTMPGSEAAEGYVPHWKTCNKPEQFRKAK